MFNHQHPPPPPPRAVLVVTRRHRGFLGKCLAQLNRSRGAQLSYSNVVGWFYLIFLRNSRFPGFGGSGELKYCDCYSGSQWTRPKNIILVLVWRPGPPWKQKQKQKQAPVTQAPVVDLQWFSQQNVHLLRRMYVFPPQKTLYIQG